MVEDSAKMALGMKGPTGVEGAEREWNSELNENDAYLHGSVNGPARLYSTRIHSQTRILGSAPSKEVLKSSASSHSSRDPEIGTWRITKKVVQSIETPQKLIQ
jgi:hypothetical protein